MRKLFIHLAQEVSPLVKKSYDYSLLFLNSHASTNEQTSSALGTVIGVYDNWLLVSLNDVECNELLRLAKDGAKLIAKHGIESFKQSDYCSYYDLEDALISFNKDGAGLTLLEHIKMKPLLLDFELLSYRQRLLRGGRQKEPLARAVMTGLEDGALVFDATAGLGRESMILAHAGAKVIAFERQLPIWIILNDALERAKGSRFFPFTLPILSPLGTINDYLQTLEGKKTSNLELLTILNKARPEVIYYDPMFPERESSAQVKKDMFVFQQVIGEDKDILEFLELSLQLATKRVVLKRPNYAPPLVIGSQERSHFVDGGQCRFDCYVR